MGTPGHVVRNGILHSTQGPIEPYQAESLVRLQTGDCFTPIHFPEVNYYRDPYQEDKRMQPMQQPFTYDSEDYGPANLALWCEMPTNQHPFSAKDPDKLITTFRGEKRLICGPCGAVLFGNPTGEPAAKPLSGSDPEWPNTKP